MSNELVQRTLTPRTRAVIGTTATASLAEGTLVQATDVTYAYELHKTGFYIADGTFVIAGSGGGFWVATSHVPFVSLPELDRLDVVGGAAVAAAGGDIELVGRNLLQGMTFDTISRTESAGGTLNIYALTPGDSGITVEITVGAGGLVLTYVGKKLTIELAAGGSSDDAVATAINADASPCNGYLRAVSGTTGNFTLAQADAPLTGGVGDWTNTQVFAGGLAALPANELGINAVAKWSDTGIVCTTQAVGAATDVVSLAVRSNGVNTGSLSAVLV